MNEKKELLEMGASNDISEQDIQTLAEIRKYQERITTLELEVISQKQTIDEQKERIYDSQTQLKKIRAVIPLALNPSEYWIVSTRKIPKDELVVILLTIILIFIGIYYSILLLEEMGLIL